MRPARKASRPASTAFTGGAGNPVLSLGEDTVSTLLSFSAVIVPVVGFLMVLFLFGMLTWGVRRAWRRRRWRGDATNPASAAVLPPERPDDHRST